MGKQQSGLRAAVHRVSVMGVALTVGLIVSPIQLASAYVLNGCTFRYGGDNRNVSVKLDNRPQTAGKQASARVSMGYWNSKLDRFGVARPNLVETAGSGEVYVTYENYQGNTLRGATTYYPTCNLGVYQSAWVEIRWNLTQELYDNQDVAAREALISHEFGHAYGLNHNQLRNCNQDVAGIMYSNPITQQRACNWRGPSIDDARGASSSFVGGP